MAWHNGALQIEPCPLCKEISEGAPPLPLERIIENRTLNRLLKMVSLYIFTLHKHLHTVNPIIFWLNKFLFLSKKLQASLYKFICFLNSINFWNHSYQQANSMSPGKNYSSQISFSFFINFLQGCFFLISNSFQAND